MKNQALFSSKDKGKKLKYGLLQFLFGTLRVKVPKMKTTKFTSAEFQKKVLSKLFHIESSKELLALQ